MIRFSKDGCGGYTAEMADRTILGTVQRMDRSWYWEAFYHYGPGYKDGFPTRKAAGAWLLGHHKEAYGVTRRIGEGSGLVGEVIGGSA